MEFGPGIHEISGFGVNQRKYQKNAEEGNCKQPILVDSNWSSGTAKIKSYVLVPPIVDVCL